MALQRHSAAMHEWATVARVGSLVVLVGALAGLSACTEFFDAISSADEEQRASEANRERHHRQQKEARQRKLAPLLRRAKVQPEPVKKLDPSTPEGMLLAELEERLKCTTDPCRSNVLQGIRRNSKTLLPGLTKLFSGQRDEITIEAIRLAGLFKHRPAHDGVARTVLLADKSIREEAIWALGAISDPRGVETLRRIARLDNPPSVMAAICRALAQIASPAGMSTVNNVFLQGTPETRSECLEAAARIGTTAKTIRDWARNYWVYKATVEGRKGGGKLKSACLKAPTVEME